MAQTASLFARKLRDWRARNGTHGRATQEGLAELLGVSVEAISKYERSLSFIRGDLEHRLGENLGWTSADILACRKRLGAPAKTRYSRRALIVCSTTQLYQNFTTAPGATPRAPQSILLVRQSQASTKTLLQMIRFSAQSTTPIAIIGALFCTTIRMVAKWALPFLLPEDEARFRAGTLVEIELSVDRIRKPILPGHYFGYCPALIVAPGHQAASSLLLSSFIDFLETQARSGILLHGFGSITCSPAGEQILPRPMA